MFHYDLLILKGLPKENVFATLLNKKAVSNRNIIFSFYTLNLFLLPSRLICSSSDVTIQSQSVEKIYLIKITFLEN
jgi:hypothetical protein